MTAGYSNTPGRNAPERGGSESADSPLVTIVIVNYNGRELLKEYLPSIRELEYGNCQVVVVDNDSSDGSVRLLHREFPQVTVVESDRNLGFSGGNNAGAAMVPEAEYFWFLNTDTKVEPAALGKLIDHIESAPGTGIVVPRIDYMDDPGTIQSLGFELDVSGRPTPRDNGRTEPSTVEPHPVCYASGSALLIDATVWDEIGGFDDENFIFGDDIYLGLQAWMRGYRVEVVPDSVVYHELGGSHEVTSPKVAYHFGRSRTRWYLKLLQPRSLAVGFPGFVRFATTQIAADVLLHRSPIAAVYRAAGYLAPLTEIPSLYRERREVQQDRVMDDDQFLATSADGQ